MIRSFRRKDVPVPAPAENPLPLRFGPFQLDLEACELRKGDTLLHLAPQPCKVLALLASRPQKVFTRREIQREIWGGDTFVDFDQGLNVAIRQIRAALCDDAETPRYIETLPRRGYRFIGQIDGHPATAKGVTPAVPAKSAMLSAPAILRPISYRRGVTVVVSLALVVAAVVLVWRIERGRPRPGDIGPSIRSIAVLPLENLSHDPEQQYFADGMTDALITDLAKIHALRVISRNSIMVYKGNPKPMPEVARELSVDAVVEGTVMRSGDRVRITAQLIEVRKDRHLWAETYEGDLRDVLSLQDQVARAIASEVKTTLTPQEQTILSNARPVDPAAHQAYLRGLYYLHGTTPETEDKAISYFQQALRIDPNFAQAYAGLAVAYSHHQSAHHDSPLEAMPRAKAAALKAIELDSTLADAHSSLGFVKLVFDWDWPGAERELRKALELNPNSPLAHVQYAEYLLLVPHHVDEGIQEFRRAYALDPLFPSAQGDLVWYLFESRRYTQSIDEAAKALENDSPFLALSYAELGRRDEALAVAERAATSTKIPVVSAQAASAYALAGQTSKAHVLLDRIVRQAQQGYICGFNVACVYSALGDKEHAFEWLEKAYLQRSD
jgi:TolB-like protein/DNA-binding winged helix-turn-helix (wHTH) protein/Tfp pilus assembly protein PilF